MLFQIFSFGGFSILVAAFLYTSTTSSSDLATAGVTFDTCSLLTALVDILPSDPWAKDLWILSPFLHSPNKMLASEAGFWACLAMEMTSATDGDSHVAHLNCSETWGSQQRITLLA